MYEKSKKTFDADEFRDPSSEYRGAPFWAWNGKLEEGRLKEQIGFFKEMGMGGFHIHSRSGLETEYLGKQFMESVGTCLDTAEKNGMKVFLYDEDRWPSGTAGGKVTRDPGYRSRYLVFTSVKNEDRKAREKCFQSTMKTGAKGDGKLLEKYEVRLCGGYLDFFRRCGPDEAEDGNTWYLYEEISEKSPWFNNESYADLMNPDAVKEFLKTTHEQYKKYFGGKFGGEIVSIFTDEPQFPHMTTLPFPEKGGDVILPYTDRFPEFYLSMYGTDFFEDIPEIIFETKRKNGLQARYRYHNAIAELFASSFADTGGAWCRKNNILLTGHMMMEENLEGQTKALGDAMRSYRSFGLPGVDMLCDRREYSTVKQAVSASRQYGRPGAASEMYGATGWDFGLRGHKLAGDWQACLGITLRVPHLAWYTMRGEAKRDLPASLFYQSPWFRKYHLIEDHFARLNTVLTRGKACVRIAVIHPVESYWLYYGPASQTMEKRKELEKHFEDVIEWLLFSQLDFDFIAESLLEELYRPSDDKKFHVGNMEYDVIVVPGLATIRSFTEKALDEFRRQGGDIVVMGEIPLYVDALERSGTAPWREGSRQIGFSKYELTSALEKYREIELISEDGVREDCFLYQMREEGGERWLFLANGKQIQGWSPFPGGKEEWYNPDVPVEKNVILKIIGNWSAELMDTLTGKIETQHCAQKGENTYLELSLYEYDSVLLHLIPEKQGKIQYPAQYTAEENKPGEEIVLDGTGMRCRLEEENVLILDQAEYRLDRGEWRAKEEVLRIDNILRKELGYPLKTEAYAQPWAEEYAEEPAHYLELRFQIHSEVENGEICLALEDEKEKEIFLNSSRAGSEKRGYFVDRDISKVRLDQIHPGENVLEIRMPYGRKTNLEWMYLTGNFGVRVMGRNSCLTGMPDRLCFGDYTVQGFPFYGGNITYICEFTGETAEYELSAPNFAGALVSVRVDGKEKGDIIFSPYRLELGKLEKGKHTIELMCYGNRRNTFGALHNSDKRERWYGPDAWRTEGEKWSYEYQLKPMGILQAPRLIKR